MANIKNSISMQDRMTPVFRSVIKSMESTLRVMRQLDKQANNGAQSKAYRTAEKDLRKANNELIKMQNNLTRCDTAAGKLSGSARSVGTAMSIVGTAMSSALPSLTTFLAGLSSGLYLAKNIASALSSVMKAPDTIAAQSYRLDTYDTTGATGRQLMDAAYKTAMESRSDLTSTADLASRILVSGATNGNGSAAINLAGLLNKASFLGGSSSEESKRALLQLSQGLASGALQGDELRAIREQAPGLTDTLAKGLSKLAEKGALPEKFLNTTMGDLKQLGADGELTAQRIIAAFKEMEGYVDKAFKHSPKTFGQAATGILNVWKRWLGLMGQGDNALAKIADKTWELLEWFESPAGEKFFNRLANGVNFVVNGILQLIDWVGQVITWFSELDNSSEILQSGLITLGIVMATLAAVSVGTFVATHWQMLLVIGALWRLIDYFMELDYSAGDVIGQIGSGLIKVGAIIAMVAMAIWDFAVFIGIALGVIVTFIVTVGILIIMAFAQVIMWVLTTIDAIFITIYNLGYTLWELLLAAADSKMLEVVNVFASHAQTILTILGDIASAIDWVFGSNLSGAVDQFKQNLGDKVIELKTALDPQEHFDNIGEQWKTSYKELGDRYAGKGKYDEWNITDNMKEVIDGSGALMKGMMDKFPDITFYGEDGSTYKKVYKWSETASEEALKFGKNLDKAVSKFSNKIDKLKDKFEASNYIDGGNLDSVGSIGSDVDISDEDIQLLRDVAARDFLLKLQTSAPQVNNNFGDIRETADVNKILDAIQDMVDEQLAVSLVVN